MILNGGSGLLYGGVAWICMVSTSTSNQFKIQDEYNESGYQRLYLTLSM